MKYVSNVDAVITYINICRHPNINFKYLYTCINLLKANIYTVMIL